MSWNWMQSISKEIFENKYMINEGDNSVEEVFKGIAKEISSKEKAPFIWENEFFQILSSGKFIPGGRILANARPNGKLKNYNNCFAIPIADSMIDITKALTEYMTILKSGGGVGKNGNSISGSEFFKSIK